MFEISLRADVMDRNIFSLIQLKGASPQDSNWESARLCYETEKELVDDVFSLNEEYLEDGNDNLRFNAGIAAETPTNERCAPIAVSETKVQNKKPMTIHDRNMEFIREKSKANSNRVTDELDLFWDICSWPPFVVSVLLGAEFNYSID